ncbi:MAG: acyl-ACP--UDP-N-acetylglucosamine O-acyltransferase [Bacillota bacterium]|nr:acyl-[acyl-carrier-protein]--UDP-N-acetylglucosamine O-acyltransferase [Bacillota bacterium]REJ36386.1 MAG: acyl-[acyl-carrier-protein]--UDP-N-acetylglucosamine O-acyltransferase [Bacillota bacterium]
MAEEAQIHPTAIVDPEARIGAGVIIGPYCVVEAGVEIGAGTRLGPHVVVHRGTVLGRDNVVGPGAILGMEPQDLKYKGEPTQLIVGDRNFIGAYVTISRGTPTGRGVTRIGSDNYVMAMVHIGHDCVVGDHVILTQGVGLSGMVTVEDQAVLGGMSGVHQFVRIGRLAMVGGMTKVTMDVPPFVLVDGHPAHVRGLNSVGLERAGISPERRTELKRAFRLLYRDSRSLQEAVAAIRAHVPPSPERDHFVEFVLSSERGICR